MWAVGIHGTVVFMAPEVFGEAPYTCSRVSVTCLLALILLECCCIWRNRRS